MAPVKKNTHRFIVAVMTILFILSSSSCADAEGLQASMKCSYTITVDKTNPDLKSVARATYPEWYVKSYESDPDGSVKKEWERLLLATNKLSSWESVKPGVKLIIPDRCPGHH